MNQKIVKIKQKLLKNKNLYNMQGKIKNYKNIGVVKLFLTQKFGSKIIIRLNPPNIKNKSSKFN